MQPVGGAWAGQRSAENTERAGPNLGMANHHLEGFIGG